ncbi:hypothetical protein [Flavobacterium sp.]|uniref:hypothetical protein n=1 Tax=Flavobacterium sp. TaxID=239 RepID=UPI003D29384A
MKKIFFLPIIFLFIGCATSISTKLAVEKQEKLKENDKIFVLSKEATLPLNSVFVGDIKIGDSGFTTDCTYNKVISDAKINARKSGANIIQLTEVKEPTAFGSSCYRIKAKLYRNFDNESMSKLIEKSNLKNKSRLSDDSDFALLHFYRPTSALGAFLGFKIKDKNDSIVGRLRNGEKFILKTKKFGKQSFYGELETKEELEINIEKGKEYFIRCSVKRGVMIGRPEIYLIENSIGINEFENVK